MVGVVILNYNSSILTEKLCNNLEKIEGIEKIIIVDNRSTDNSVKNLKKLENNKIVLVISDKNKGYAYGNNLGIKYIIKNFKSIKYMCILNPDVEIEDSKIFIKLIDSLKKDKSLGIISPFMLMNGKYDKQLTYWKCPEKRDNLFLSLGFTNKFYKKINYKKEVIPGSFLFFSTKVIKKINFLDEGTFLYHEENILYKKLKSYNLKMKIIEEVQYNHNHEHKERTLENILYHNKILFESTLFFEKHYNIQFANFNIIFLKFLFYIRSIEIYMKYYSLNLLKGVLK